MSSYKSETVETTVADAISEAFGEFQALRDEMRETADNMESGGMGHMEKAQRALEAADTIDGFADNEPEVPDAASDLRVTVGIQGQKRKGRATSRAVRFDNALALVEAAKDAVEAEMDRLQDVVSDAEHRAEEHDMDVAEAEHNIEAADTADDRECAETEKQSAEDSAAHARRESADADSDRDELETLRDDLENVIGDAQSGVEFPGMYG